MSRLPARVSLVLALTFLNAFIWFGLALMIAAGIHPGMQLDVNLRALMAGLFLAAGSASLVLYVLLRRRRPLGYWGALCFFTASVLVNLFDDMGAVDIAFMVFSALILVLLIIERRWFLRKASAKRR